MSTEKHKGAVESPIEALLPKTRRDILGLLVQRPSESLYLRDIARRIGGSAGTVRRELSLLTRAGILTREERGGQVYFRANEDCSIFPELRGLVLKTVGLVDVLAAALAGLRGVRVAFAYGSFARGDAGPESDVDVLVVGDVTFAEVAKRLRRAQERLGREVNPTVYSAREFRKRVAQGHHFVTRVLEADRLFIIGDAHVLARLAEERLADESPE